MNRSVSPGQGTLGLVEPVLRTDGYCSGCNVNVRDIFVHRASEAHKAGGYRRSTMHCTAPLPSARKVAVAAAYRSLRDYDLQDDDSPCYPDYNVS